MAERATWIVQLFVDGPITVTNPVRFQQSKGFNGRRQFYSEVSVHNSPSGLRMSVTAFARESEPARKAALVFVGDRERLVSRPTAVTERQGENVAQPKDEPDRMVSGWVGSQINVLRCAVSGGLSQAIGGLCFRV